MERPTRRVLGIQGTSSLGDALVARINAVAPLLQNKPKLEDISNLEVAYSPPFASAMDIINTVANVAENVLEGRNHTLDPDEFAVMWQNRESGSCTFVDTRLASTLNRWWKNTPVSGFPFRWKKWSSASTKYPKTRPWCLSATPVCVPLNRS